MSYLVLARKYRPQRFTELVGQEHVARTLTNAIEADRVHHAFLFTGARGVGKTSAARILAKALSCEKAAGPTAEPCGVCGQCQEIVAGRSVDVIEIDGASNTGVDDVRTLREGARYMPAKARLKIYIIDEVHMLSSSAFNALLKTLEEPPPHVVFIFATTEAHKIPMTILSRCQRYDFKLLGTAALTSHLEKILSAEQIAIEPDGLRLLVRQAAGSVRDALSLLDQVIAYAGDSKISARVVSEVLGIADRPLMVDLARAVIGRDAATALRALSAAAERGLDLGQLARSFLGLLRDIEVVARVTEPGDLCDATADELVELRTLGAGMTGAGMTGLTSVLFDRWARAVEEAGHAFSPRLILEMALVDLCQAEPLEPLGDLLERLEALEGRLHLAGPSVTANRAGIVPPPAAVTRPVPPPKVPSTGEGPRSNSPGAAGAVATPAPTPPPAASTAAESWRRTRADLEQRRPRIGALLTNASVLELGEGKLVLGFADAADADAVERVRADVEQALAAEFGAPIRLVAKQHQPTTGAPMIRAQAVEEAEALRSDKRRREQEARQHPIIQKTQDLFGVGIREIKT